MTWRNCLASVYLVDEVNAAWPNRDKASDGTLGDPAHAARVSDHNPNEAGVVRARDIDRDLGADSSGRGRDMRWLANHLRQLAIGGDPRLNDGGYLIYNGQICGGSKGWEWRDYDGTNPHISHLHISFARGASGYDNRGPWGIARPFSPPVTPTRKGLFMHLTEAEEREILAIARKLRDDYLTKGRSVRQIIVETGVRTEDIASGRRPA
jgi:hypothetical protein